MPFESAGRVPNATRRLPGILPSPVTMAASILAPVLVGHCAGSSNSARTGARPCARRGIGGDTPAHAPLFARSVIAGPLSGVLYATIALGIARLSRPSRTWRQCSNAIRAWVSEEATMTVSPRVWARGPIKRARQLRRPVVWFCHFPGQRRAPPCLHLERRPRVRIDAARVEAPRSAPAPWPCVTGSRPRKSIRGCTT